MKIDNNAINKLSEAYSATSQTIKIVELHYPKASSERLIATEKEHLASTLFLLIKEEIRKDEIRNIIDDYYKRYADEHFFSDIVVGVSHEINRQIDATRMLKNIDVPKTTYKETLSHYATVSATDITKELSIDNIKNTAIAILNNGLSDIANNDTCKEVRIRAKKDTKILEINMTMLCESLFKGRENEANMHATNIIGQIQKISEKLGDIHSVRSKIADAISNVCNNIVKENLMHSNSIHIKAACKL